LITVRFGDPGFQARGGGAVKKIAPSRGRRENFWGLSCEKSRFYAKQSFFSLKIPRHISDHDTAIASIKCPKATSKSFTRDIWLYDQTDFVRFNQMLTDINWNEKQFKVSLRIMGSNKVLVLPLILVGLSITFLRLKIFTRSIILLLFEHNRFEFRSPVIMMFSL
jgi:hypothetical protein